MICNPLGVLQRAAVQQIRGNSGCPEGMAADRTREPRLPGTPLDHLEHIQPVHAAIGEIAAPVERPEEGRALLGG